MRVTLNTLTKDFPLFKVERFKRGYHVTYLPFLEKNACSLRGLNLEGIKRFLIDMVADIQNNGEIGEQYFRR